MYSPGLETTRHPVFQQKGIVFSDFGSSFRNILILQYYVTLLRCDDS